MFEFNLVFHLCFHRIIHGDHITNVDDCFLFILVDHKLKAVFFAAATAVLGGATDTVAQ